MKAMLPQLLQLLSEDQVLKQALESDLVNHLLSLAMRQSGAKIQLTGSDIYAMIQPQIAKMAESDFSGAFGCALTVGTDNQGAGALRIRPAARIRQIQGQLVHMGVVDAAHPPAQNRPDCVGGDIVSFFESAVLKSIIAFLLSGTVNQGALKRVK